MIVKNQINKDDIENILEMVRAKLTRAAVTGAAVSISLNEEIEPVTVSDCDFNPIIGWENFGTDIEIKIGPTGYSDAGI